MKKQVICIVGKSCSGKDYIANKLSNIFNIPIVVSYTTRPMRSYETNGKEHWFISKEEMNNIKSNAIAYTKIGDIEYCTTIDCLSDKCIYIIDPNGIDYLSKFDNINIKVIYVKASYETRLKRAQKRSDYNVWAKRCKDEDEMFDKWDNWDLKIENEN